VNLYVKRTAYSLLVPVLRLVLELILIPMGWKLPGKDAVSVGISEYFFVFLTMPDVLCIYMENYLSNVLFPL